MSDNQVQNKCLTNFAVAVPSERVRQQEIASLEQRLTPVSPDEVEDRLSVLFAQFATSVSGDAGLRAEGYVMALRGICLEALDDAVRAILCGETECNPDFMPSAPRLAQVCRRFQGYAERELSRARRRQAQLDGPGYYLESWMERGDGAVQIGQAVAGLIPKKQEAAA